MTRARGHNPIGSRPRPLDRDAAKNLDGYVWGVRWQELYPGFSLIRDSTRAQRWSRQLDVSFHKAVMHGNGHHLSLVFSDLRVDTVHLGHTPYVVADDGTDL